MYRVLVWGTGIEYNRYFNLIKYYEMKEELVVIGIAY